MATGITLKLREIKPTFRILQGWFKDAPNPPAINLARRNETSRMRAYGCTRKQLRRYIKLARRLPDDCISD